MILVERGVESRRTPHTLYRNGLGQDRFGGSGNITDLLGSAAQIANSSSFVSAPSQDLDFLRFPAHPPNSTELLQERRSQGSRPLCLPTPSAGTPAE